jgi:hypothetical protein
VNERPLQFEWDEVKADTNLCKHGINGVIPGILMNNRPMDENDMPVEIDFSKGVRLLHHLPPGDHVPMPVSIERGA